MFYSLFCIKTSKSIYTPLRCTRYYQHSPVIVKAYSCPRSSSCPWRRRRRVSSSCVVIVCRHRVVSPSAASKSIQKTIVDGDRCAHGVIVVVVLHSSLLFFFLKRSDRIAGDWSCIFDPLSCRRGRHSLLATRHHSNRTKGRCNFCWIFLELLLTMMTTTSENPKLARFRQLVADKRSQRNGDEGSTPMSGSNRYLLAVWRPRVEVYP